MPKAPERSPHPAAPIPPRQLVLDLPIHGSFRLEDFMPADCNREALAMLLAWRQWPQPACVLVGPPSSGRTHLAHIFAQVASARFLHGPELWRIEDPLAALGDRTALAIDDADAAAEPRRLLEFYNLIHERGGRLLLVATAQPREWGFDLPDLVSRLTAALALHIGPPDEDLLAALLVKQFADRQLQVAPEVIHYLVAHMERTFAAARRLVHLLDRLSLASHRAITLPLARLALAELVGNDGHFNGV